MEQRDREDLVSFSGLDSGLPRQTQLPISRRMGGTARLTHLHPESRVYVAQLWERFPHLLIITALFIHFLTQTAEFNTPASRRPNSHRVEFFYFIDKKTGLQKHELPAQVRQLLAAEPDANLISFWLPEQSTFKPQEFNVPDYGGSRTKTRSAFIWENFQKPQNPLSFSKHCLEEKEETVIQSLYCFYLTEFI